jgi:hypothetical protein
VQIHFKLIIFNIINNQLNIYHKTRLISESGSIKMQKILLEWIWEVYYRIKLPELFAHTCALIDIYLAFNIIDSKKF